MTSKLKSFLYILLRDHVSFGDIEGIIKNHVEIAETQVTFEGAELSAYVDSLVRRLSPPETSLKSDDVPVAPAPRAVIGSRPFADKWRHWRER
jgi:hypothetical protein